MADDEEVKQRKEREPISVVCLVVLVVACVAITGAYVNDTVFDDDDGTPVVSGKTVQVNYTGSFYNYYNEGGSIFQTTVSGIANNDSYIHSAGYTAPGSYTTIDVKVGSGKYLSAFENALIGHNVGDKVKVKIDAANGYAITAADSANAFTKVVDDNILYAKATTQMTVQQYKAMFDESPVNGTTIKTGYGWDAAVVVSGNNVMLSYLAVKDTTYTAVEGAYGTVTTKVVSVTGDVIEFTVAFSDVQKLETNCYGDFKESADIKAVKMIELNFPGCYTNAACSTALTPSADGTVYVIGTGDSGFEYRTFDETKNIDLYFVIEIVALK